MRFISYKPFSWFVGEDVLSVYLSDGDSNSGPAGNKTTRYSHVFRSLQAPVAPEIIFRKKQPGYPLEVEEVADSIGIVSKTGEDTYFLGDEDKDMFQDFVNVKFASPAFILWFEIQLVRGGCCLRFPQDESLLHVVDRTLGGVAGRKFAALGSADAVNAVLNATAFRSDTVDWHGEAEVSKITSKIFLKNRKKSHV